MRLPRVYPILDTESLDRRAVALETAAAAFLEGGAGILQIRHKGHWSRAFFESARTVARLCREAGAAFVVNDRADFAMLLDAGLHVGQDDLPPRDARRLMGPDALLGYSSHNLAQLCAAGGEPVTTWRWGRSSRPASKRNPDPVIGPRRDSPLPRFCLRNRWWRSAASRKKMHAMCWRPAPIRWRSSPTCLPEPATAHSLRERMEEWQLPTQSGLVKGLGLVDATTHRDGLDDRLRHLHRGGRHRAAGGFAGPDDDDVGRHGADHHDRGAQLRRTGGGYAAGGRAVRLPARSLRSAGRVPVRLDDVPGDPDRHDRGGGGGLRQVHRRLLPRGSATRTI